MTLAPIRCTSCDAPLPLADPTPTLPCPYCGERNTLPPNYVEAAALHQREHEARERAEPLWRKVGRGAPGWSAGLALALVVFLPPLATLVGLLLPGLELGVAEATALFTLPALLPGAGLWIWSGAISATTMRFRAALAARAPEHEKRAPGCRTCGAPLGVRPGALTATCGYCGTDSLLERVPVGELARALGRTLTSLGDAVTALRRRRAILGLGTAGAALLVAGSSVLLWITLLYVV